MSESFQTQIRRPGRRWWQICLYLGWLLLAVAACQPREEAPAPPLIAPEKQAEMQEIRLIEIQDGDKRWELVATGADYSQASGQIRIFNPRVELYDPKGGILTLTASEGSIEYATRRLTLNGAVQVRARDYEFTAAMVAYDPQQRVLTAVGPVEIAGERLRIAGRNLTVNLKQQRLVLAHHDRTEFRLRSSLW